MAIDPELFRLRDEVIGLQARLDEVNYRLAEAVADSVNLRSAFEIERDAHESAVADLKQVQRELGAVLESRNEINRLRSLIDELHQSRTWRLGRFLLLPIRALRRALKLFKKV